MRYHWVMRYQVRNQVGWRLRSGLRTRPMLTLALMVAAVVVCCIVFIALLTVALVGAIAAGIGFVGYQLVRRSLQRQFEPPRWASQRDPDPISEPEILRRYLDAVEEFGRLVDRALRSPVDTAPRRQDIGSLDREARGLRDLALSLVGQWRGDSRTGACLAELEAASETLCGYLEELQRRGSRRLAATALRWRRNDLARRRDLLVERLRATDFRQGSGTTASLSR